MSSPITLLIASFFSGFSALIYEVVWLKDLTLIFGSTARASAITLCVFFCGLSTGGLAFGKYVYRVKDPIRLYAYVEGGIGVSALWFFFLRHFLRSFSQIPMSNQPSLSLLANSLYSIALLFPTVFLIGGTFPILARIIAMQSNNVGSQLSLFYGVNTIGGALGALVSAFFLPPLIGFKCTYAIAAAVNIGTGLWVFYVRNAHIRTSQRPLNQGSQHSIPKDGSLKSTEILFLCFISGLLSIIFEVVCIRLLSQVTINCVYSFAVTLVTFICALGCSGFLSKVMSSRIRNPLNGLVLLFTTCCFFIGLSPVLFYRLSQGLTSLYLERHFIEYILSVFGIAFGTLFLPIFFMGSVFPFLFHVSGSVQLPSVGWIGKISAFNTFGASLGAILGGFVMLPALGAWMSVPLLCLAYLCLFLWILWKMGITIVKAKFLALFLYPVLIFIIISRYPKVKLNDNDILREVWDSPEGTLAVIERSQFIGRRKIDDLYIRLNNLYTLGGLGGFYNEQRQGSLPLMLFPGARSVFSIGLATGITSGSALFHPIESLVVAELIPEVVIAARKHFSGFNNGLFTDPRVKVVAEDARSVLGQSTQRFDVINSDLFTPWQAGTGILYTKEHFELVKSKLNSDGVFVQWLPLYQLSWEGFGIIARTFLEVFPNSTLWRGTFQADFPTLALIGTLDQHSFSPDLIARNLRLLSKDEKASEFVLQVLLDVNRAGLQKRSASQTQAMSKYISKIIEAFPLSLYAGNLGMNKELFESFPVNTEDRPIFEYFSPKMIGSRSERPWLTGLELATRFDRFFENVPLERDPAVKDLSPRQWGYVRAGLDYYKYFASGVEGENNSNEALQEKGKKHFLRYLEQMGLSTLVQSTPKGDH